jgi:hypothetical protein
MEQLGGDPFTPQDQNILDELNQMNEEEKIYSFPITAANGGRVGLRYGGDTMGGINDKSISSPGPDRSKVSDNKNVVIKKQSVEQEIVNSMITLYQNKL